MPITYEEKVLYSSGELSQTTNIALEEMNRFIEEHHFTPVTRLHNTYYIEKPDLLRFFDECLAYIGVAPVYYDIPDDLQSSASPWSQTLITMYHEPFVYGTSLSPQQGQLLKEFVGNISPQTIVEIGSFIGISTLWMAAGLERSGNNAVLHAIDLFGEIMPCFPYRCGYLEDPLAFARQSAVSAQLAHRIQFHKMDSYQVGQHFDTIINKPVDLLYIDGDHSIRGCMNDFALFAPHVVPGGYIILHDIYPEHCGWDGPRYLLDYIIKSSPRFEAIEIKTRPRNYGIAIIQKKVRTSFPGYSPGEIRLDMIRAKAALKKTSFWQSIRTTRAGKILKKIFPA